MPLLAWLFLFRYFLIRCVRIHGVMGGHQMLKILYFILIIRVVS